VNILVKRLHEFLDKEYSLFFDFPLYNKILIESKIEEKDEYEPLFEQENSAEPYSVVHYSLFFENKDFQAMKKIFLNEELVNFHYCPSCDKEVPIVYQSLKKIPQEINDPLLTTDINISSEEQYNSNYEYAQKSFNERYKTVTNLLFGESGILKIELSCTAKERHKYNVIFMLDEKGLLTKIGQNPSVRDFDNSSKRYKNILNDKNTMKELSTSIGLKAHGVGVGSFVYLRRIFERLIYDKFKDFLLKHPGAIEEDFLRLKMKEKIEFLKDYLPPFLVNNKVLYGILSKGIHELSEKECLDNFDTVYAAIIVILEQKLQIEEEIKRQKELEKTLQKIATK
jgi:hypothetical protein